MLDYFITSALILLVVAQGMLIRGCFKINDSLAPVTDEVGTKFDTMTDILNEAVDCLYELAGAKSTGQPSTSNSSPFESIVNSLISGMVMPPDNAEQESQNWTIPQEVIVEQTQTENDQSS